MVGGRNPLQTLASSSFKSERKACKLVLWDFFGLPPLLAKIWRERMTEFEWFFSYKISPKTLPLKPYIILQKSKKREGRMRNKMKKWVVFSLASVWTNSAGREGVKERERERSTRRHVREHDFLYFYLTSW